MAVSYFNLMLTNDHPVAIQSGGGTVTITNAAGSAAVYYGSDPGVSSANNQGTIAAGASQSFTQQTWIRSVGLSSVTIATDSASPGGGGGSQVLLSTTTLAADAMFDVSGIPGTYNDLILVLIGRSNQGGVKNDTARLRLNGDPGLNYYAEQLQAQATTASGYEWLATAGFQFGLIPAGTATAGLFAAWTWVVYGYASTNWRKVVEANGNMGADTTTTNQNVYRGAGWWNSTAAVTRVSFDLFNGTGFLAGSQLRIYGRT